MSGGSGSAARPDGTGGSRMRHAPRLRLVLLAFAPCIGRAAKRAGQRITTANAVEQHHALTRRR